MNRTALGIGVVVVLAIVLVAVLLSGGDGDAPPTTVAAPTTTTAAPSTTAISTTTTTTTTTVAPPTSNPTTREDEVEALVKELDFALMSAAFAGDEAALGDLIAGPDLFNAALDIARDPDSFFTGAPSESELGVSLVSVKLERDDCVVADIDEDATAFTTDTEPRQSLFVLWPAPETTLGWRIANRHASGTPESVWIRDCDLLDREWRP